MGEPMELQPASNRLAHAAVGLLAVFNRAGVLEAADVHVAQRLGALGAEADQSVLLAIALAVRAARQGAVCLDLHTIAESVIDADPEIGLDWPAPQDWVEAVARSPLVTHGVLVLEGSMLYLDRYHREEEQVCADLVARLGPARDVDEAVLARATQRLFPAGWEEQRNAALTAARHRTTVITGGPGTGKTASVARMLALIHEQHLAEHGRPPRIALAAPTGKASIRLQESVEREAASLEPQDRSRLDGLSASTLHRLLGWRPETSSRFRHDRSNPLAHDVIVIDEMSMVSLTQMARLLEAVRPQARLILVGDRHQLASVEAGAVLADIVAGLQGTAESAVVELTITHRTRAAGAANDLDALAQALREQRADDAVRLLTGQSEQVRLVDRDDAAGMAAALQRVEAAAVAVTRAAQEGDGAAATGLLDEHRLLCAHREGPFGVGGWNRRVEHMISEAMQVTHYDEWYPGRPVMITANDQGLKLSNGDLGVTVRTGEAKLRVAVRLGEQIKLFAPTRLSGVETVYAMTVHKSQGSEARHVTVVLPPVDSPLLTRELFYTAVTRARQTVTIIGSEAELRAAMGREVQRASGLADRLRRALATPSR